MVDLLFARYAQDLPAIAFVFSSTFCLFPVFRELKDKSPANTRKVVGHSTLLCCLGYQVRAGPGMTLCWPCADPAPTLCGPCADHVRSLCGARDDPMRTLCHPVPTLC